MFWILRFRSCNEFFWERVLPFLQLQAQLLSEAVIDKILYFANLQLRNLFVKACFYDAYHH